MDAKRTADGAEASAEYEQALREPCPHNSPNMTRISKATNNTSRECKPHISDLHRREHTFRDDKVAVETTVEVHKAK